MANTPNDEPGNDARHTGDRIGFPHGVADGVEYDSASLDPGVLVAFDPSAGDEGELTAVTGVGEDVAGVLYTLPVEGQSRRGGPYVRGDRDATVAVRGQYTADLSEFETDEGDVTTGAYLDDNATVYVKHHIAGSVYEVMLR